MTPDQFSQHGAAWITALTALIAPLTALLLAVAGMIGVVLTKLHDITKRQDRQGKALGDLQLATPPPAAPQVTPTQAPAPIPDGGHDLIAGEETP